jgi:chromosome segregation ATPase
LRQETVSGAARLGEALGLVGRELAVTSEGFLERLAAVNGALEQQTGKINRLIEAQAEHSAQQRAELLAATAEQTQTLHLAGNALAGLSAATNEALARQEALQQAMRQLSETNLEHKFTALTEAVSRQAQETQALSQSMALAAQATNDMLAAQASLHTAMQQLHQSGFEQAMFSVRDSLVSVAPVLASFREPFVLQAIPATAGRDGRS